MFVKVFKKSISKYLMLLVSVLLFYVLYSANERRITVEKLEGYVPQTKSDVALLADFTGCLKQRTFAMPLMTQECGSEVLKKHGADAIFRIDAIQRVISSNHTN